MFFSVYGIGCFWFLGIFSVSMQGIWFLCIFHLTRYRRNLWFLRIYLRLCKFLFLRNFLFLCIFCLFLVSTKIYPVSMHFFVSTEFLIIFNEIFIIFPVTQPHKTLTWNCRAILRTEAIWKHTNRFIAGWCSVGIVIDVAICFIRAVLENLEICC